MSQTNLSEETLVFYKTIKSVTLIGLVLIALAHLITVFHASEQYAEQQLKKVPRALLEAAKEAREAETRAAISVSRLPGWEDDGTHASHLLTTADEAPRVFPFPLGKASSDSSNLYFESGTAPKIGHFGRGRGESYSNRLASAVKSQDNSGKIESSRLEAIRKYEFDMRRKQWKRRLSHLKALCIVIILSYVHKYLALVALALLTYQILNAELERLMKPPPGSGFNDPYSERFRLDKAGRKRPFGMENESSTPNMGMTYIYQQDETEVKGLAPLASVPLRGPHRPLLTSCDERFGGRSAVLGDQEKESSSGKYGKYDGMDGLDGLGGGSGGKSGSGDKAGGSGSAGSSPT